jgi:hypothetical protein
MVIIAFEGVTEPRLSLTICGPPFTPFPSRLNALTLVGELQENKELLARLLAITYQFYMDAGFQDDT